MTPADKLRFRAIFMCHWQSERCRLGITTRTHVVHRCSGTVYWASFNLQSETKIATGGVKQAVTVRTALAAPIRT